MYFPDELTEEQERLIEKRLAKFILDNGLETPAIFFLETIKPMALIGSRLTLFATIPLLMILGEYGEKGYSLIRFFEKQKNLESLMRRIETSKTSIDGRRKNKENTSEDVTEPLSKKGKGIVSCLSRIRRLFERICFMKSSSPCLRRRSPLGHPADPALNPELDSRPAPLSESIQGDRDPLEEEARHA